MTFHEYLKNAWSIHPLESEKLFGEFKRHLNLIQTSEDVNAFAHLITHVSGEHLGKWKEGLHLLQILKANPLLNDYLIIDRYIATLSLSLDSHYSIKNFSDSDQARILAMAASALAFNNQAKRAADYIELACQIAKSKLDKSDPANKSLAIAGNNLASSLEEKESLTHEETKLMVQAAYVGRIFWELAGTWKEVERAEYRVARSFLKADILDKAFLHAEKCLEIVAANNNEPLEVFFGFEVMALVERARRNNLGFEESIEKMKKALLELTPEDQSWCKDVLEKLHGSNETANQSI